jgi:hypothetical protein
MVGVAEGACEGVIVGRMVAVGSGVGEIVPGAQLPTKEAIMKNARRCLIIAYHSDFSIAFPFALCSKG